MSTLGDAAVGTETYGSGGLDFPTTRPDFRAWIAFTTTPGADPIWEEITPYLRSLSVRRGRQHELDRFETGTATLTLDNRDRRFDPTFVSSPYYPNVVPMRRVRVAATWNGVEYPFFAGYIESWPQHYVQPHEANVAVSCVDGFRVFAAALLPESPWTLEVRTDSPRAWWRLGESSGQSSALDSVGSFSGTYESATLGVTGLIYGDSDTGVNCTTGARVFIPYDGIITAFPFTIEGWFKATQDRTHTKTIFSGMGGTDESIQIFICPTADFPSNAGQLRFQVKHSALQTAAFSNVTVDDGRTHHFVCVANSAASLTVYIDGVDVTNLVSTYATGFPVISARYAIGNYPTAGFGDFPFNGTGTNDCIDDVAVYSSALSATRAAAHYVAGATGWAGDRTGARITRILDWLNWPAADRDIDTGSSTLQGASFNGTVLDYFATLQNTEQGAIFMKKDGKFRHRERHTVLKDPYLTSAALFGDSL